MKSIQNSKPVRFMASAMTAAVSALAPGVPFPALVKELARALKQSGPGSGAQRPVKPEKTAINNSLDAPSGAGHTLSTYSGMTGQHIDFSFITTGLRDTSVDKQARRDLGRLDRDLRKDLKELDRLSARLQDPNLSETSPGFRDLVQNQSDVYVRMTTRLDRFEQTAKESGLDQAVDYKDSFQKVRQQLVDVAEAYSKELQAMSASDR